MSLYIPSKATNWVQPLFTNNNKFAANTYPINSERLIYFYSGRYALSAGLTVLGLKPGDKILLPSYNCWIEVETALSIGLNVQFYRIKSDLTVDVNHLERCIDEETRAVLVTHYMGFPQSLDEIKDVCRRYGLYLIEDCAHAFLSDRGGVPVGTIGDISIFSFRKSLPIPDGGGLVLNLPGLLYGKETRKPNGLSLAFVLVEYLKLQKRGEGHTARTIIEQIIRNLAYWTYLGLRFYLRGIHKVSGDRGHYLVYPSGNFYRSDLENWGISDISRKTLKRSDIVTIKRNRQRNFQVLLEYFRDDSRVKLPFSEIEKGACPLFFPIIIENRDGFYKGMREMGIAGHDWWRDFHPAVPWDQFAEASFLKRSVLGLPVHQELKVDDMERIIKAFEAVWKKIGV